MSKSKLLAALFAGSMVVTGCSRDLQVTPLKSASPRSGIAYALPYTQYAVTETWSLDYCPDPLKPDPVRGTAPKLAMKVAAIASSADDGDLAFVIDPLELQNLTSVTSFNATYFDGRNMISTINASVDDHSAQIIGNIVKTAVKILPLTMGVPAAPGAAPGAAPPPILCSDTAVKALAAAKAAKGKVDAANTLVEAATKKLTQLTSKVQQMGANVDDKTKQDLSDAIDALAQATAVQTDATDTLAKTLKPITFVKTFTWPEDGKSFSRAPDTVPAATLTTWLKVPGSLNARAIYLQIERQGSFGRLPERPNRTANPPALPLPGDESISPVAPRIGGDGYAPPNDRVPGIRYRMPAAGRLVACFRSPCGSEDVEGVIATFDGPIAQLGIVNVLPFRSRTFGNNSFTAAFNQDGSLKSAGYEQKTAPAEVATGAVADATGQLADVLSPTARLKAGTDYLTALKGQRDAYDALKAKPASATATEQASLDADTALINARIANLNAQIALEELRVKQGGGQ